MLYEVITIRTADPHPRLEVLVAQLLAGHRDQVRDLLRLLPAGDLAEQLGDLAAEHVNRRHHHVAGALPGQLDDPFPSYNFV